MKKDYKKPCIISEALYEKSALKCSDYAYYSYTKRSCNEEFVGYGKETGYTCYDFGCYS